MCGRYTLSNPGLLPEWLEISEVRLPPRFNIAPTQEAPVVLLNEEGERELAQLRWGLVPGWSRDLSIGSRMINARAETAHQKPSFRDAFRSRRCLVPADGFFEWERRGGVRQPHLFRLKTSRPFALAGLWERPPSGAEIPGTFTILTCEANPLVSRIHPRMPVMLPDTRLDDWLDPGGSAEEYLSLLTPFPEALMESLPVSRRVNSPAHDDSDCIQPLDAP